jgi:ABC-2 type transport system ATP-binding protein
MDGDGSSSPTASPSPDLLRVTALTKYYGRQLVLADVSFAVTAGEVLGVIGPNGAGKTTLLEAMAGLVPVAGGDVAWNGNALPASRRRDVMFYVPDGVRPYDEQNVSDVLAFAAGVYRRSERHVSDVVAAVGLVPVLDRRVRALSKGYCRRLMLALGLLTPQPLLLLDEPFDGLDLKQTREATLLVRRLAAAGRTLVVSIHQLNDAERTCDRLLLLDAGRIRGMGTLEQLRQRTGLAAGNLEDIFLALT